MSIKPGEIYFVREVANDSASFTPFVKIGLVTAPKVCAERLLELQTGNPRRLTIPEGFCISTDAVSMVEAQLHRRLSNFRIGGEWFKFTDEQDLANAVEAAKKLSEEASLLSPLIEEAEVLQNEISTETILPSSDELDKEADWLDFNKKTQKRLKELDSKASELIQSMRQLGREVGSVAGIQRKTYKPRFQELQFKADYPEIHERYQVEEVSLVQRFSLKPRNYDPSDLDPTMTSEMDALEASVDAAISNKSIEDLAEPLLTITRLMGQVQWNIELSTARIKVACGRADGIEGVCTWKRENKSKLVFDTPTFVAENPELYTSYLSDEVTREYVMPYKGSKRK